ncbi:hypothetical protein BH11BAC2_BH11BAC2_03340 [soil metagenome]
MTNPIAYVNSIGGITNEIKMLENLINLVKEHAGDAIVNNPAIPNEHNDAAITTTATGIFDGLKEQITAGNLSDITGLFSGGAGAGNPVVGHISSQVSQQLMHKFNLDAGTASTIVSGLIPTVMSQLAKKTSDPHDKSFEMNDIMSALGGEGNIMDKVKGLFSL